MNKSIQTLETDDLPDADGWSRTMDRDLLAKREAGTKWRAIHMPGKTLNQCKARHSALLKRDGVVAGPRKAAPKVCEADRDGLEWLIRKRRLTPERAAAAGAYRMAYREAMHEGVAIKSGLAALNRVDGAHQAGALGVAELTTDAKRKLFVLRWVVLQGQTDMLTVMDGVCGGGRTLRELGAGDQHRPAELEAVLKVALDLVASHVSVDADAVAKLLKEAMEGAQKKLDAKAVDEPLSTKALQRARRLATEAASEATEKTAFQII